VDRASDGSLVFAALNSNRVVEVPYASTTPGEQLGIFDYNGCACQRWFLTLASGALAATPSKMLTGVSIYPVPAERGAFTIDLGSIKSTEATTVQVFNSLGQSVRRQVYDAQQTQLPVAAGLAPGIYQVRVQRGNAATSQKQIVQ
jgi:arabinan endo-1,5-alpha-L-arabinosidase